VFHACLVPPRVTSLAALKSGGSNAKKKGKGGKGKDALAGVAAAAAAALQVRAYSDAKSCESCR
jgi:hypothetical protein